jgi:hypothetical protein
MERNVIYIAKRVQLADAAERLSSLANSLQAFPVVTGKRETGEHHAGITQESKRICREAGNSFCCDCGQSIGEKPIRKKIRARDTIKLRM